MTELAETRDIAMKAGDVAAALASLGAANTANISDLASKISAARQDLTSRRVLLNAIGPLVEEVRAAAERRTEIASASFQANMKALSGELSSAETDVRQTEAALVEAEKYLNTEQ